MKKKIILVTVIGILLLLLPVLANAGSSGTCGPNLTWVLDDNGTLTISGTGVMYEVDRLQHPWGTTDVKNVIISEGITRIGGYAFYNCKNLVSVSIPNSMKQINNRAFGGCSSLTSITIPNGITYISNGAFERCINLSNINIPNGIQSLGGSLFEGCTSLTSFTIPSSVKTIYARTFYGCDNLTSITIPEGITSIDNKAFEGCKSLADIVIPSSVTSIGPSAFSMCSSLKNIKLPEGVTIGISAFSLCSSLQNIDIPEGVTRIYDETFQQCSKLTSITFPKTLTDIEKDAFYEVPLKDVYYRGNVLDKSHIIIATGNSSLVAANWHYIDTTATVKGIKYKLDNEAMTATVTGAEKKTITSLTIPEKINVNGATYKVTSIDANAFKKFTKLKKLTIGKNITSIGKNAFNGCKKLKTTTIKATNLKTVGAGAFKGTAPDGTYKCPKKQKEAYEKLLRKKDVPKGAQFK